MSVMVIHTVHKYELSTVLLYQHQSLRFVTVRCYLMRSNPVCPTFHKDKKITDLLNFSNSLRCDGCIRKYFQNVLIVFALFLFIQLFLRYLNSHVYKFHPNTVHEVPEVEKTYSYTLSLT